MEYRELKTHLAFNDEKGGTKGISGSPASLLGYCRPQLNLLVWGVGDIR